MAKKIKQKQAQKQSQKVSQKVIINLGKETSRRRKKQTSKPPTQKPSQNITIYQSPSVNYPKAPPEAPAVANTIPNPLSGAIMNGINAILARQSGQQTASINFANPQNRIFSQIPRAGLDPNIRNEDTIYNVAGRYVEEPEYGRDINEAYELEEERVRRIQQQNEELQELSRRQIDEFERESENIRERNINEDEIRKKLAMEEALRSQRNIEEIIKQQKEKTIAELQKERTSILEDMSNQYSKYLDRLRNPIPLERYNLFVPPKPLFQPESPNYFEFSRPDINEPLEEESRSLRDEEQERLEKEAEEEIRSKKQELSLEEIKELIQPEDEEISVIKYQSSNGMVNTIKVSSKDVDTTIARIINFNEKGKERVRKIDPENIFVNGKKWKEL
jgi:hypothetical protein